jgi:general secretion pathway protein B
MSYILDALKRADAERERGHVPGLHARQLTAPPMSGQGVRRLIGWAVLCAVVLVAVAAFVWRSHAPSGDALVADIAGSKPAPGTPVSEAVPLAIATGPQTGIAKPQAAASEAAPAPAPSMAAVPMAKPATEPSPPVRVSAASSAAAVGTSRNVAAVPAPAKTANPVPLLSELPEDTRRQIPALAITGAVYSEIPGQRMLLVNAQVLKQGSTVGADLTLEEIHASSSVFNFKGIRFRLAH